jgi:hypothetical protein
LYKDLRNLLAKELVTDESATTQGLIVKLRRTQGATLQSRSFLQFVAGKSPRAIRLCEKNTASEIKTQSSIAFRTRSERIRLEALTALHGVSIPMASAILTLTNPRRYGVIDIRVWQLLFDLKSVRTKPGGIGFNFNNWYHYLMKLRYHARELKVTARCVEYSLFCYHKKIQAGVLYK